MIKLAVPHIMNIIYDYNNVPVGQSTENNEKQRGRGERDGGVIFFLKAYSPANRTRSPQGFSQVQILHKLHNIKGILTYTQT